MRRICATLPLALRRGLRAALARLSIWINERTGGRPGEYLCVRWTRTRGSDCWPCRLVAAVLGEPHHCIEQFIWEVRQRVARRG